MSGVERAGYMDNQMASILTEQYTKERRIQREYFTTQEAAGLIRPKPPTPQAPTKTLLETMGVPQHVHTLHSDPVQVMNTSISKAMWVSNAGYIVRDGATMTSVAKKEHLYDQDEINYLKSLGYMDKTHNRRRDEFVNYVEAAARQHNLMKGGAAPK